MPCHVIQHQEVEVRVTGCNVNSSRVQGRATLRSEAGQSMDARSQHSSQPASASTQHCHCPQAWSHDSTIAVCQAMLTDSLIEAISPGTPPFHSVTDQEPETVIKPTLAVLSVWHSIN